MANHVAPPVRVPYRYGLLSTAQIIEQPEMRLYAPYQFDSVACHTGMIWNPGCAPGFTVTFTRTANPDEFQVIFVPPAGPYEASIDGGAFQPFSNGGTFVETTSPFSIVVRETTGLQREATGSGLLPGSPQGTAYVFTSGSFSSEPKVVTEGILSRSSDPFVVVSGVSCTLIADQDIEQKARDAMASAEQRLVEQHFWTDALFNSAPVLPVGAVVQPLTTAVAVLEEYLRNTTGYVGMLHSDAFVAPFASENELIYEANPETIKRTPLWTPWVFGGGYARTGPSGQAAPGANQAWIYATGTVVIHRGPVFVPGGVEGGFNAATNQAFIPVERTYVVIPDCPVAAVLADVTT